MFTLDELEEDELEDEELVGPIVFLFPELLNRAARAAASSLGSIEDFSILRTGSSSSSSLSRRLRVEVTIRSLERDSIAARRFSLSPSSDADG